MERARQQNEQNSSPTAIGKSHDRAYHSGNLSMPFDRPILGVARLDDPTDKYLMKWSRAEFNP